MGASTAFGSLSGAFSGAETGKASGVSVSSGVAAVMGASEVTAASVFAFDSLVRTGVSAAGAFGAGVGDSSDSFADEYRIFGLFFDFK
jgi:hypothetical protein